ncbi:predicted protein [Uncinocarpus reesii 1704]|uniref:Uncharacterized protein n=1 Tax=Uncinocarpus reesii (strain UAMH 1704) TaxID=336963 RepID=C4JU41_UNCRE|nr:uncharacterized protein UREG_05980 [Uncinocarpus reesii 1704]EEP81138.1 predicted protein [Uncinocarpus reesii 1704]
MAPDRLGTSKESLAATRPPTRDRPVNAPNWHPSSPSGHAANLQPEPQRQRLAAEKGGWGCQADHPHVPRVWGNSVYEPATWWRGQLTLVRSASPKASPFPTDRSFGEAVGTGEIIGDDTAGSKMRRPPVSWVSCAWPVCSGSTASLKVQPQPSAISK